MVQRFMAHTAQQAWLRDAGLMVESLAHLLQLGHGPLGRWRLHLTTSLQGSLVHPQVITGSGDTRHLLRAGVECGAMDSPESPPPPQSVRLRYLVADSLPAKVLPSQLLFRHQLMGQ